MNPENMENWRKESGNVSVKVDEASESLSNHQRTSPQDNHTLENSPALLGQSGEITKVAEMVRLSAQSVGEATVLASKDNLISYKEGDQLMQSLYMSSLSHDYPQDEEDNYQL